MKVLIALDDSPESTRAGQVAADLFSNAEAQFFVVSVVDSLTPWIGATGLGAVGPLALDRGPAAFPDGTEADDEDARQELRARAETAGVPAPALSVRTGEPVTEICAAAEEEDVDEPPEAAGQGTTL